MRVYTNSLGITCVEPAKGYLLKKNGETYKKVYLGINDRAELYEEVVDADYVFTEDETEIHDNQNIKHAKKEFIKLSKYNLSQYLEEHPLFSTVKYEDGRYYNVTAEKQNLLLTNIATYQMAQQTGFNCPLTWNDTGEECELWTFEQLLQLSMEIRNYVSPIISYQQYMEVNINKCTTIEQLNEVNINFTEEAIEEYKPIYYKKIGVNNE